MTTTANVSANANSTAAVPKVMKAPIEINDIDWQKLSVVYSGNPEAPLHFLYKDVNAETKKETVEQVKLFNKNPNHTPYGPSWYKDVKKGNKETGKIDVMCTLERPEDDPCLLQTLSRLEEMCVDCLFENAIAIWGKPKNKETIRDDYFGGIVRQGKSKMDESTGQVQPAEKTCSLKIGYVKRENYFNPPKWAKPNADGEITGQFSQAEREHFDDYRHDTMPWRSIFTTICEETINTENPQVRPIPYFEVEKWRNCRGSAIFHFESSFVQNRVFVKLAADRVQFCDRQEMPEKRTSSAMASIIDPKHLAASVKQEPVNDEEPSPKRVKTE